MCVCGIVLFLLKVLTVGWYGRVLCGRCWSGVVGLYCSVFGVVVLGLAFCFISVPF